MTTRILTPEVERKVKFYQCSRCKHEWQHRRKDADELPIACPKCKSPYWNREKTRK